MIFIWSVVTFVNSSVTILLSKQTREFLSMFIGGAKCPPYYFLYSKISPGWHSRALQIASRVENRIALALPFFSTEMFAIVMPTFSASSVTLIFRFANMTSTLMMMAMLV